MEIVKTIWGTAPDGQEICRYKITNASGASVELCSAGAAIVAVNVPDRDGKLGNVVMCYADAASYIGDGPFAGKIPGRFANRIALGKFTLDGVEYSLPVNNGPNHLHGGPEGFANRIWESRIEGDAVEFMYFSEDGEMGYPGNFKVVAHYEWSEENELKLTMTGECDAPTIVNLTNHVYFNLRGHGSCLDHVLKLNASEFLPTDDTLIPLGESMPVAGTPMDFTNEKTLGKDIDADFDALKFGKGYDNCYVIDGYEPGQIQSCAELFDPETGRFVEVLTTQPGVQVYTGNWLGGCPEGPDGRVWNDYDAVAIECQHYPDTPNKPDYPSVTLRPGEVYEEAIIWAFSVKE